jgi:protein-disulfide isomerase
MKKQFRLLLPIFFIGILVFAYIRSNKVTKKNQVTPILIPPITQNDHIRGDSDASVTLVEYSDFECPSCILFQPTIRQILQTYGNKIRWIERPYPLPQHMHAEKEAEAAACVNQLGGNDAFWKFSDKIFSQVSITEDGTGLSLTALPKLAQSVGVKPTALQKCLDSNTYASSIQKSIINAQSAGINQLPAIVVMNKRGETQLIVSNQPFSVFQTVIDQALQD